MMMNDETRFLYEWMTKGSEGQMILKGFLKPETSPKELGEQLHRHIYSLYEAKTFNYTSFCLIRLSLDRVDWALIVEKALEKSAV